MTAVRDSAGRASILGARPVADMYGTLVVTTKGAASAAYKPTGAIGCFFYCVNAEARMRLDAAASTALTYPQSVYIQADGTYYFALNSGVSYVSLYTVRGGTPDAGTIRMGWILGAGA